LPQLILGRISFKIAQYDSFAVRGIFHIAAKLGYEGGIPVAGQAKFVLAQLRILFWAKT